MALKDDLITARSYIVFVLGLLVAFSMVYYIEQKATVAPQVIPPVMMVKSVVNLPNNQVQATPVVQSERAIDEQVIDKPVPVVAVQTVVTEEAEKKLDAPVVTAQVSTIQPQQMVADNAMKPKVPDDVVLNPLMVKKRQPRVLTAEEMEWARIAWQYFANNTQATGLVNSVNGYPSTTMWDTASYMLGAISAQHLGIISKKELNERMANVLVALEKIPLFDGKLPNKSYNTKTLAMVNYANKDATKGIGWSAVDIGRLLVPLKIIYQKFPAQRPSINKVLARWQTQNMLDRGLLFGASLKADGTVHLLQEGRLGYEQYAAKTFALFNNWSANAAASYTNYLEYVIIDGIKIAIDKRDPKQHGAYNYMLSEPFMLDGLEFGFDKNSAQLAEKMFLVQEQRYKRTGVVTAVTEDHIDVAPYFVYNTVYVAGKSWAAITDKGQDASAFRALSTKAAFAWYVLYQHNYSDKLINAVKGLNVANQGWYAGLYEEGKRPNKVITANTNGVILESLAYLKSGKLLAN